MQLYQQTAQEILKKFGSSEAGLSPKQVKAHMQKYGLNVVDVQGEPLWRKIIEPFMSVFMAVLGAAAAISLIKNERLDAVIIMVIIGLTAGIYYVQRFSTERVLRSLRKHEVQKVDVIRGGKAVIIDAEQLVPGDVIILNEGDKVPADARLMHVDGLRCDESLLTGESSPVTKQAHPIEGVKEVYERTNMLFQGAFVVSGQALAVVVATGNSSEFGQLAALSSGGEMQSPVQDKIDRLISQIIFVVAGVAALAFGLSLYRGLELAEALRFVLSLAVSAVPEGLPVAISVVLVLGMRRMAKRQALVRNMRAIENLGLITTIATDKTGTLTKNRLTIQDVWMADGVNEAGLAKASALAINGSRSKAAHDPLDTAMQEFANRGRGIPPGYKLTYTLPFDLKFAMSGNVWAHGSENYAYIKGAPEHVLAACSITKAQHEAAVEQLHSLTGKGYRVIALACMRLGEVVDSLDDLPKKGMELVGYIAVADILRPEAKRAVRAALDAGVSVRMITGDHFGTAYTIGKELGMVEHRNQVFDSRQAGGMTEKQLERVVEDSRVFSRVVPEVKYKILSILKKRDITAMTGDGVNDVPALTNAHVGVAMGAGSQIAKDAGDIVLLDNNFKSIIEAMREGRIVFSNIRRMLFYLLATNAGEVLTMIGALAIGLPLPVATVQILWINLVTDSALVIPLGLEPGEKNVMKAKPRDPQAPILGRTMISRMVVIALSMAGLTLIIFYVFLQFTPEGYARTIAFNALVVMQWSNAFNARSDLQSVFSRLKVMNAKFYIGLAAAIGLQLAAMFGPLQGALHVVPVQLDHLLITGSLAIITPLIVSEIHKAILRGLRRRAS